MKYIDADLLRKEIERQKGICTAQIKANPGQTFPFVMEMTGYDKLLSFLDTLEAEERPEPYIPVYDEEYLTEKQRLFKEHHGEVDVDKMLAECRGYDEEKEEPDKSLEEAAEEFAEQEWDGLHDTNGNALYTEDYIKYTFIAGAEWQRAKMLKDAVEGEVMTNGFYPYEPRIVAPYPNCPYTFGDKVRIVVLKAEEE